MSRKEPKTLKGQMRKADTGDGRKKTNYEKLTSGDYDILTGKKKKR